MTVDNMEDKQVDLLSFEEEITQSLSVPKSNELNKRIKKEIEEEEKENKNSNWEDEFEETKKFYYKLKGFNQYDLTENNYDYWKHEPFVGKWFREFVEKSSEVMVLTQLVNERVQINRFDRLIKQKGNGTGSVGGLLKYVSKAAVPSIARMDDEYLIKSEDFLKWRFRSHLYRFGYIRKYIKEKYELNDTDFKTYNDVKSYCISIYHDDELCN